MKIVPSILTDDMVVFRRQVEQVKDLAALIQVDIADGVFVDSVTIALSDISQDIVRGVDVEAHLMVKDPLSCMDDCRRLGFKRVYIHYEATDNMRETLSATSRYGIEVGIALNPETPADRVKELAKELSAVLVMSVHPGRQGQPFMRGVLEKISHVRAMAPHAQVGIDGGIKLENIGEVASYRPDYAVVGSALFASEDKAATWQKLNRTANAW